MHIGWYIDEPSPGRAPHPVADPLVSLLVAPPPLALGSPTRTGASGPRLQLRPTQYSQQPLSRSTSRRKTPCHGFQDSKRYTRRRPLRTIWQEISIIAARNVLNSIRNSVRFWIRCSRACRDVSGTSNTAHAFRLQARLAMTMYAQLLTRLSTGVVRACTPPLSWATSNSRPAIFALKTRLF